MKKIILLIFLGFVLLPMPSCTSPEETLSEEEETEVEDMLNRDQERMDSMRRAIEQQMKESE